MLFRPTYCANCGEKIERTEWRLWTSRRFCILCESEFRGIDLLPKAAAAVGILGFVFGMSGYVNRNSVPAESLAARQLSGPIVRQVAPPVSVNSATVSKSVSNTTAPLSANERTGPQMSSREQTPVTAVSGGGAVEAPIYFCGAQTKKGTPCSRRVRGNVRCFQHTGMPAMLPPDKLRVG